MWNARRDKNAIPGQDCHARRPSLLETVPRQSQAYTTIPGHWKPSCHWAWAGRKYLPLKSLKEDFQHSQHVAFVPTL
ncbi:hypothetical protein chiPu_0000773 [Chiloscyllium punctatum]|uniref:Uncharacterized protein n=1 Tax=Chiloscyllium punctatum TaxID=137246 RepID=A0A401RW62_CHIPU|nr:hypothetical protein [Chiloscyllium punctatum]